MYTIIAKVYGLEGHRQKVSFEASAIYDWSAEGHSRHIALLNADATGSHEYSVICVTRDTKAECEEELRGQVTDGIFENCRIGRIELVSEYSC